MYRKQLTLALFLCATLLAGTAFADDVLPPDWRGNYGTLTYGWDYFGTPGSGPGMIVAMTDNIQGNPGLSGQFIGGYVSWDSNCSVLSSVGERQSVIEINDPGGMTVALKNYNWPNPEKYIRLQVTSWGPGIMRFHVGHSEVDPGDPPWDPEFPMEIPAVVSEAYDHGDGFVTRAYDLVIEPNPAWETIGIDWTSALPHDTVFVDQIVIDTWCVPEPASLSLLAAGGLILLRRRR